MTKNSLILYTDVLPLLYNKLVTGDITGGTVELLNHTITFEAGSLADGLINIKDVFVTNDEYLSKEIAWYESQSLDVLEISKSAKIWLSCCDNNSKIHSNYGYLMFSRQNGYQFNNVVAELRNNKDSRRAVAYYTNPMMHYTGGKDHICTLAVGYRVINNEVHAFVTMRSNDLRFGLIGADLGWQIYMLHAVSAALELKPAKVHWHAMSLHLYERHFEGLKKIVGGC